MILFCAQYGPLHDSARERYLPACILQVPSACLYTPSVFTIHHETVHFVLTQLLAAYAVMLQHSSAGGLDSGDGTGVVEEETEEQADDAAGDGDSMQVSLYGMAHLAFKRHVVKSIVLQIRLCMIGFS
jgi:hypothetical protein